jgi:hypothetical protein
MRSVPGLHALPEYGVVAAEDGDKVDPALGKELARVPIEYHAAARRDGLELVEQLRVCVRPITSCS